MSLIYSASATATVAVNTNVVTIAGIDLAAVLPGMVITLGSRDSVLGEGFIISEVTPNGTSGGTLKTLKAIPSAFNNAGFVVDTRDFNGSAQNYIIAQFTTVLNALLRLTGPATNLFTGSKLVALDKDTAGVVSRLLYAIGGRAWAWLEQRTLTYTPTGGTQTSAETWALRALPDGTTPTDAILVDLSTGGVDVLKAGATMTAAATVDLASSPAAKVLINGTATITSFGVGKHKERDVRFAVDGATLVHNATSLILPNNGANISVRAGDMLRATSDGSGNWTVRRYQRADGTALSSFDGAETDVASAATTDIGAAATQRVRVTGTTTITSFGTAARSFRIIRFAASLTLTHNATSLILPGAVNIATAAGDVALAGSDASGNWTVLAYWPNAGFGGQGQTSAAAITAQTGTITTATGSVRYVRIGQKLAFISVTANITNGGTGAGAVRVTLPFTVASTAVLIGRETSATGKVVQGLAGANTNQLSLYYYDNTYPGATGTSFFVSGMVEVQ